MSAAAREGEEFIDVRVVARKLKVQPIELRRQLAEDGVPVIEISSRVHRLEVVDYESWCEQRKQRTRDALMQQQRRANYVKGRQPEKRRASFVR